MISIVSHVLGLDFEIAALMMILVAYPWAVAEKVLKCYLNVLTRDRQRR